MKSLYFLCSFFFILTSTKARDERIPVRNVYTVYSYSNLTEDTLYYMSTMYHQPRSDFQVLRNGAGLWMNIIIIPSAHPKNYKTIRALDMIKYTPDFYTNLFRQYNKSGNASATYNGLLKAAQMAKEQDSIMMFWDKKLRDEHLLPEILNLTLKKKLAISFNPWTPPDITLQQIKEVNSLELRYISMMGVSQVQEMMMNSKAALHEKCLITKHSNTSQKLSHKNVGAFVYDMVHATEDDFTNITIKMEEYFTNRTNLPSNSTRGFPVVSSLSPDFPLILNPELAYTRDDFQNGIPHNNATENDKTSLYALRNALEFTNSANNVVVYFTDNEPKYGYDLLPELIQKLYQDKIQVIFHTYGKLSNTTLPLLYKTLAKASKYSEILDYERYEYD